MKGVVSRVACENVLKAFSLKLRLLPIVEPVDTTRQAKLSKFVKADGVPFPRFQKTDRRTHTQNTAINITD